MDVMNEPVTTIIMFVLNFNRLEDTKSQKNILKSTIFPVQEI